MKLEEFKGKSVVVTGAGAGMGKAIIFMSILNIKNQILNSELQELDICLQRCMNLQKIQSI